MSIPKLTTDLAVIQKLSDLPNATDGLTADQLKAKFDEAALEIQTYINEKLLPAIIAEQIPFTASSEINAKTVDTAIREVQKQVKDASSGTIVNGAVTKEKLAAELLARVYGGRPWVSMDTPGSAQNTAADFPIGQIWLRPSFIVVNAAKDNWTANGCTVAAGENRFTVTGNRTVVTAAVSQTMTNIGQDGDRVMVLFDVQNRDSEITGLTVSLNSSEEQDAAAGLFESSLIGGALTVRIAATWPSTSLAGGSFDVVNYAVVNIDQMIRQTMDAEKMTDWAGYLNGLLPLHSYVSDEEVFIHVADGIWWPMGKKIYPVERGGTGLNTIGVGELLVGGGENRMEKLETPKEDESFLQFHGGHPVWRNREDTIVTLGALRITTGTYSGTGSSRTVSLPIQPKLLYVYTKSGVQQSTGGFDNNISDRPCMLADGVTDAAHYTYSVDGGYRTSLGTVKLSGNTLTMNSGYLCNRSGITYNWVAIY